MQDVNLGLFLSILTANALPAQFLGQINLTVKN